MSGHTTTAYLIRHGEYEQSVDGQGRVLTPFSQTGLSETGRNQIAGFASAIRKRGDALEAIYTSPYQRTRESAAILQSQFGTARLVIDDGLCDVYTPGWWGVPMAELKAIGGDVYNVSPRTLDQESYDGASERIWAAFRSIVHREKGHTVGLVFHGDPIRVLLYRLEHPAGVVPAMRVLSQSDYLDKGEAWRLELGYDLTVHEKILVGRSQEDFRRGERKY